jgi:large subunit ribosomal protein L9
VAKLGRRGEVRDVSDGYARNFLIPKKLALGASAGTSRTSSTSAAAGLQALRIKGDAEGCSESRP